jgi:3-oxoadipate enol-lactonase
MIPMMPMIPTTSMLGYRVHGHGSEIVVVLHEWLGDHTNWDLVIPFLDVEKAKYLFLDLRGYGFSRDLWGSYSLDEACADILYLLDSLSCKSFHVVCHSMTALIGQWLAQSSRARVKGLFMISPVPASGFKMDEVLADYSQPLTKTRPQ